METVGTAGTVLLILTSAYALMILWFTLPLFRKRVSGGLADLPYFTVIVATRNEEENIGPCLAGILGQDYPRDHFSIIVSDDHSTDRTREKALEAASLNPSVNVSVLVSPGKEAGKKQAVDRAVGKVTRGWVVTTDADTQRGPRWLRSAAVECSQEGTKMVLGPVMMSGTSFFQVIQRLEFTGIMGLTSGSAGLGTPLMGNGANLFYRKSGYDETGGMTGNLNYPSGDDQFLLAAFRKRYGGKAIRFAMQRNAMVTTAAERTLSGFLNQRMRWVSKSKGYRDPAVVVAGLITYLAHLGLLAGIACGVFFPDLLLIALACWVLKMASELPMVARMAVFFGNGKDLWLYVPAQLFQVLYVPVSGLAGLLLPYRWKGRVIRA